MKDCTAPGWFECTNMVPFGETSICEQGEGWCVDHGFYKEAFHTDGNIVEFEEPMEMTIEQKAAYAGLSVVAFKLITEGECP